MSAVVGPLITSLLEHARSRGTLPSPLPTQGEPSYFSLPTKEAYRQLRRLGKKLLTLRELLEA